MLWFQMHLHLIQLLRICIWFRCWAFVFAFDSSLAFAFAFKCASPHLSTSLMCIGLRQSNLVNRKRRDYRITVRNEIIHKQSRAPILLNTIEVLYLLSYIVIQTIVFRIRRCSNIQALYILKTCVHKHNTMHFVPDSVLFSQMCRFAIGHWWIMGQFINYCYNL